MGFQERSPSVGVRGNPPDKKSTCTYSARTYATTATDGCRLVVRVLRRPAMNYTNGIEDDDLKGIDGLSLLQKSRIYIS
jgi:hypothetical protein